MKKLIVLALGALLLTSCGIPGDVEDIIDNFNEKVLLKESCTPNLSTEWNYRPNIFWEEKYPVDLTGVEFNEEIEVPEVLLEPFKNDLLDMINKELDKIKSSFEQIEPSLSEQFALYWLEKSRDQILENLSENVSMIFLGDHSSGTFEVYAKNDAEIFLLNLLDREELPVLITGSFSNNCHELTIDLTDNQGIVTTSLKELILTK